MRLIKQLSYQAGVLALLAIMLTGVLAPVAATPVDDLISLAAYYPEETSVFATVRTDDAYIEALNGVLAAVVELVPDAMPPGGDAPTLTPALDDLARDAFGTDFAAVRAWLGDRMAVGIALDVASFMGDQPPLLVAIMLNERDPFEALLVEAGAYSEDQGGTITESGAYTVYTADSDDVPVVAISDDIALLGLTPDALNLDSESSLLDKADFNETRSYLPGDDYNALVYLNMPELQQFNLDVMAMSGQQMPGALVQLNTALGSQMWGFTILEDNTFTLDIGQGPMNADLMAETGIETYIPSPVDLDFAQSIPQDAALVLHASEFGPTGQAGFQNIRVLGELLREEGGILSLFQGMALPPELRDPAVRGLINTLVTPEAFMAIGNVSFSGLTGLSLERDVLPVLDGDYAMYLRPVATRNLPMLPAMPDFGMVFESSDTAGAETLMSALIEASEAYDTGYVVEAYGSDGAALVFPIIGELIGIEYRPFDLLVAQSDNIFALGTRPGVEAITGGEGLDSNPEFMDATRFFLPDSQQVGFVNLKPSGELLEAIIAEGNLPERSLRDLAQMRQVLALMKHATLSGVINADSSASVRMTLTLGDEPVSMDDMDMGMSGGMSAEPLPTMAMPTATPGS